MRAACGDGDDIGRYALDGSDGVMVPPAVDRSTKCESAWVVVACGDRGDLGGQTRDQYGNVALALLIISELTDRIVTPASDSAVGGERTGVQPACSDCDDARGQALDLDGSV